MSTRTPWLVLQLVSSSTWNGCLSPKFLMVLGAWSSSIPAFKPIGGEHFQNTSWVQLRQ